jgi:hypothetical protein
MSDPMKCEACGKVGRRRSGTYAPQGWLYAEVLNEDEELEEDRVLVIAVCGEECARALWKVGPGKIDLTLDVG